MTEAINLRVTMHTVYARTQDYRHGPIVDTVDRFIVAHDVTSPIERNETDKSQKVAYRLLLLEAFCY